MSNRGKLVSYCPAHDYGDPGYPPEECPYCEFEADTETINAELLEALERCASFFKRGTSRVTDQEWDETAGFVSAAIAKARGEVGK